MWELYHLFVVIWGIVYGIVLQTLMIDKYRSCFALFKHASLMLTPIPCTLDLQLQHCSLSHSRVFSHGDRHETAISLVEPNHGFTYYDIILPTK